MTAAPMSPATVSKSTETAAYVLLKHPRAASVHQLTTDTGLSDNTNYDYQIIAT